MSLSFSEYLLTYFLFALLYAEYLNFLAILVVCIFKPPTKCLLITVLLSVSSTPLLQVLANGNYSDDSNNYSWTIPLYGLIFPITLPNFLFLFAIEDFGTNMGPKIRSNLGLILLQIFG